MGLQTDLNLSPYYDDYDETKDFYRILFRPGVAVQVRELNQLQSIIQKQIERFGDNILKRGTIVDGCQISFFPAVAYVRIKDSTADLRTVDVSLYKGYNVRNSANLVARIIDYATGFENQGEDTNTLYLDYVNSGNTGAAAAFTQGQILTVYDSNNAIYSVKINEGSSGFSVSDTVVVYPAIEIQDNDGTISNFDGSFSAGQTIIQETGEYTTQLEIISIDISANTKSYVLRVKPLTNDLRTANTGAWSSLQVGYTIRNSGNTASANVSGIVGTGASADIQISPTGKITEVVILNKGSGYYVAPHVTISTATATTAQINSLNLEARNYIEKISVLPNVALATGSAYGISVTDGVIYQKGYFSRVEEQFTIIDKYANTPHQQSVGFVSHEKIVDFKSDETLLDNAGGSLNVNAPGANRLQIKPKLQVFDDVIAEEDPEFFPIVSFSEGKPYRQYRTTAYNKIADEMAKRTSEESGDYVLDKFLITTRSALTHNLESTSFSLVIDPGHAYIDGYRVQTHTNYVVNLGKGIDTESIEDSSFDTVFGNYLRVDEYGGAFIFKTGAEVDLYDQPRNYLSATASEITSNGNLIGTARIRSVGYEAGHPGSPNAVYKIYLFDINMSSGKNFKNARSVFYSNGLVNNAVADCVLEIDPSANGSVYVATIKNPQESSLMFGGGKLEAVKSVPNITYTYRTTANVNFSNTGVVTHTLTGPNDTFAYTGELSEREKDELILTPVLEVMPGIETLQNGEIASLYYDANTDLITIEGANTALSFLTVFKENDWIYIDGANNVNTAQWARVTTIKDANTMYAQGSSVDGYVANDATIKIGFNEAVQVSLKDITGRSANVSANGKVLTITTNIGSGASVPAVLTFNVKAANTSVVSKTPTRNVFIKIQANTHSADNVGPWCLGYPDIIRLKAVYKSTNINTVNSNSTDVTNEFYIDHNQTKNHYDLGFLYKKPTSRLSIGVNDAFLVQFDYLVPSSSGGLKTINSYPLNDALALDALNSEMNTLEIPEVFGSDDEYFDLRDILDFRPAVSPTATATVSEANVSMTVNPEFYGQNGGTYGNDVKFNADDKRFPSPDHDVIFDYIKYQGRVDSVIVNSFGEFNVLKDEIRDPNYKGEIVLNHVVVPAYPSLPDVFSRELTLISDTKMANEKYTQVRVNKYQIETPSVGIQPRGYTMHQIGKLERRIEALEYYARLSETEDIFKDRPIPSDLDPTLDRYKFGFFVDNFSGPEFADLKNPEYNASIYEFRLYPNRKDIALKFKFSEASAPLLSGDTAIFPFIDYRAVRQPYATTGPVSLAPPPSSNIPWCLNCIIVFNQNKNFNASPTNANSVVYEERIFTLTSNTRAQGYIMNFDYDFFDLKNRVEIFQSTTSNGFTALPIATSEQALGTADPQSGKVLNGSVLLSAENRVIHTNRLIFANYGRGGPWTTLNRPDFSHVAASGLTAYPGVQNLNRYWTKNAGRINIKLDLSKGRYLKVRVVKGCANFAYILCVPLDCPPPPPPPRPPPPPPPKPPPRVVCIPPPVCRCIVIQKDAKPDLVNKFVSFIDAQKKELEKRIEAEHKRLFGKTPTYAANKK